MCLPPLSRNVPAPQQEARYVKPPQPFMQVGYMRADPVPAMCPEEFLEIPWLNGADFSQMFAPQPSNPLSGYMPPVFEAKLMPPVLEAKTYMPPIIEAKTLVPPMSCPSSPLEESDDATVPCKKQRKRRLAVDLSPSELAKMREVNRVAAQRHRSLAKKKAQEQERRANIIAAANDELRAEIDMVAAELDTLKRVVMDLYGPTGPHRGALLYM